MTLNETLRADKIHVDRQVALQKLRVPFPPEQIGKLPRLTCAACRKAQWKMCEKHNVPFNWSCPECGNRHSKAAIHLDFVGHADVTNRLLDVDPEWYWEPLAFGEDGLPQFDRNGGLWIRLTIAGMTRLGYGDAPGKSGGDATKEVIGDAIRNASMRFGIALDLWSKSDLTDIKADGQAATVEEPASEPPVGSGVIHPLQAVRDRLTAIGRERAGDTPVAAWLGGEFHAWSQGGDMLTANLESLTEFADFLQPPKTAKVSRRKGPVQAVPDVPAEAEQ